MIRNTFALIVLLLAGAASGAAEIIHDGEYRFLRAQQWDAEDKEVKVALVDEGPQTSEVTIAEVLSQAGYKTAHVGKWHQGFDHAVFPLHQQVQLSLMMKEADASNDMMGTCTREQLHLQSVKRCAAALVLTVLAPSALAAGDGAHHHKNHIALILGAAQEVEEGDTSSGGVLGVAYERKLSDQWYFAAAWEQEAFGDKANRHTVVFAGALYGITDRWSVYGGPGLEGKERGELDHFVVRVGTGYTFPLSDRFSLKPEFTIDFVEGGTQVYVFALALGYGF